jgi:CheY-like chemotaxis protein
MAFVDAKMASAAMNLADFMMPPIDAAEALAQFKAQRHIVGIDLLPVSTGQMPAIAPS